MLDLQISVTVSFSCGMVRVYFLINAKGHSVSLYLFAELENHAIVLCVGLEQR